MGNDPPEVAPVQLVVAGNPDEGEHDRHYALSVFAKKNAKVPLYVHPFRPGTDVCRQEEGKAKGILFRYVDIGSDARLLVVGVGFSPVDSTKQEQVDKLLKEIEDRTAEAHPRKVQVVACGDINTRLVLPTETVPPEWWAQQHIYTQ